MRPFPLWRTGVALTVAMAAIPLLAQAPTPRAQRVNERIQELRREADRLAQEARTLLGDLRMLEVERELRTEELRQADQAVADGQRALDETSGRLAALEAERVGQLPDVKQQLVDMYKRGRSGYARLLFGASDVRGFARAARAVSSLSTLNERRIADHRKTLDAVRSERERVAREATAMATRQAEARRARVAADRAVTAHNTLITEIDARRDLNAQYVGELQQAYEGIQRQVAEIAAGRGGSDVAVPLTPFRGAMPWPVPGRVSATFGQSSNRLGGTAVRNGVEVASAEGTPVRAVHFGTVGFAGPFTGFGNLVIVDHGSNNFSLYGNLGSTSVARGDMVNEGTELGRVGASPATLYFEMRIDGQSTDPVQWLEPR